MTDIAETVETLKGAVAECVAARLRTMRGKWSASYSSGDFHAGVEGHAQYGYEALVGYDDRPMIQVGNRTTFDEAAALAGERFARLVEIGYDAFEHEDFEREEDERS